MSEEMGANVRSLDAIKDVRAALIKFQERATTAMADLRQKIDRTVEWLELDRPNYWRNEEHRAYDELATARVSYDTCRLRTVGGRRSDCIEEKKAYERAKVRMDYVRQKQEAVRRWVVQSGREANEYRARTSNFQRTLENDLPLMIAQLARMTDALEAYAGIGSMELSTAPVPSLSAGTTSDISATTEHLAATQELGPDAALPAPSDETASRTDLHE